MNTTNTSAKTNAKVGEQFDTISAIATGIGAGIGIIRLSGINAVAVADKIFRHAGGQKLADLPSYRAAYGHIVDCDGNPADEVIALVMRAPKSYTTEDVVELQCHGGIAVLRQVLQLTYAAGARPAERGEFTKRAFLHGRLDLAQAQGVMDVVSAKTNPALQAAQARLAGRLSAAVEKIRGKILALSAHLAAVIDFPEDDVPEVTAAEVTAALTPLIEQTKLLLSRASWGRILRDGISTAIVGKPNVGKSSLLNFLAGEERAIVTDLPGTTRDSIEANIELGSVMLRLIDTAGIRAAREQVEQIGVERAKAQASAAQLILAVFDGSRPLDAEDKAIIELLDGKNAIVIINKRDLTPCFSLAELRTKLPAETVVCHISTREREDIKKVSDAVYRAVGLTSELPDNLVLVAEEEQANKLGQGLNHLQAALDATRKNIGWDFAAIDLRSAWEVLGEITGDTAPDEIISQVFAKFCVGK